MRATRMRYLFSYVSPAYLRLLILYFNIKNDCRLHCFVMDVMKLSNDILWMIAFCISRKKPLDRKSTRLNSSHVSISYAVFCLKKKKNTKYKRYKTLDHIERTK